MSGKTMSQIEYLIDELKSEREELIKVQIKEKVSEFTNILTDMPAKDEDELRRVLTMMAQDIKNIARQ